MAMDQIVGQPNQFAVMFRNQSIEIAWVIAQHPVEGQGVDGGWHSRAVKF